MDIKEHIASIEGFPKEGIVFRDVTPVLQDPECLHYVTKELAAFAEKQGADIVLGPEARGFMFGVPVALEANLPFAPVRKPGKLPRAVFTQTYDLEYGQDTLCIHTDAIQPGQKVIIVDDLLATGGTVGAMIKMVEKMQGIVVGCAFVIELDDLHGRDRLGDVEICALTHYKGE